MKRFFFVRLRSFFRPESNRLSDMDTVKDSSVTNQNCANPNLTPALYDEIMSQHEKGEWSKKLATQILPDSYLKMTDFTYKSQL